MGVGDLSDDWRWHRSLAVRAGVAVMAHRPIDPTLYVRGEMIVMLCVLAGLIWPVIIPMIIGWLALRLAMAVHLARTSAYQQCDDPRSSRRPRYRTTRVYKSSLPLIATRITPIGSRGAAARTAAAAGTLQPGVASGARCLQGRPGGCGSSRLRPCRCAHAATNTATS